MKNNEVRGYKVFNSDWTCSPNGNTKQYSCPGKFEEDIQPIRCGRGMHFCKVAADCFNYYNFNSNNKVAEIIAYGDIVEEDDKCCTNKIEIIRELSWQEVLSIVNIGKACTGLRNSGNSNTGNRNTGNRNSGNWNSGDFNSGDRNSGDWNKSNHSTGVFNTVHQPMLMFNKPTDMTFEQWRNSDAYYLLNQVDFRPTKWIPYYDMTDEEKQAHPDWETCEGYLKVLDTTDCCKEWWSGLSMNQKRTIQNIPNFDSEVFFDITGIRV